MEKSDLPSRDRLRPNRLFSDEQVLEIRSLHKTGLSIKDLANKYQVAIDAIWKIISNASYRNDTFEPFKVHDDMRKYKNAWKEYSSPGSINTLRRSEKIEEPQGISEAAQIEKEIRRSLSQREREAILEEFLSEELPRPSMEEANVRAPEEMAAAAFWALEDYSQPLPI